MQAFIFDAALGLIQLVDRLIDRGRQTGELTPEQDAVLSQRAAAVFGRFEHATPPPPPGGPQ